jgi:hypothetical protein
MGDRDKLVTIDLATARCREWAIKAVTGDLSSISETVQCESVQKAFFKECCGGQAPEGHDEF